MKLQKLLYAIVTGLMTFSFAPASAIADEIPPINSSPDQSNAPQVQEKSYDCHYAGAKADGDMTAKITKNGDTLKWSDDIGESGTLTILPDRVFSFDYTYVSVKGNNVSGKMTFKVQDNGSLDGTYSDSFDNGKITCTENK
jgi:hypothetical protein